MKRLSVVSVVVLLFAALGLTLSVGATDASIGVNWQGQFFNNCCLVDPPGVTTNFDRIDFEWGAGAPVGGINADNFSARFTSSVYFPRGTYRFSYVADDVVRLSINLEPLFSTLNGGQTDSVQTVDKFLDGIYSLQIDYVERTGNARLKISWENLNAVTAPAPGATTATVLVSVLNVRSEPSLNGAILTKVGAGQSFGVLAFSADSGWVQINANGVVGWVSRPLVRIGGGSAPAPNPQPQPVTPGEFVVTAQGNVRLRSAPVFSNNTITTIPSGSTAPVLARNEATTWLKVDFNGTIGWVNLGYVRVTPPLRRDAIPVATS